MAAVIHGRDAGALDTSKYTHVVKDEGGGVARHHTHIKDVSGKLKSEWQGACGVAEGIVRRSTQVANFVFDSVGSAPEPHFQFFFETGTVKVTRGDEVLRIPFHELDFAADGAGERGAFMSTCRKAIGVATEMGICKKGTKAYAGQIATKVKSTKKLSRSGFESPNVTGCTGLQSLVKSGLKECDSAQHAQFFMASIRTTMTMIHEYKSAFTSLVMRYEGAVATLDEQKTQAQTSGDRAGVTRFSREISSLRRQLAKVKAKQRDIQNLDVFALYHTAFIQSKMKADVLSSGKSLSLEDLKGYQKELKQRILRHTAPSQKTVTQWYLYENTYDDPESDAARKAYANEVSGMIIASSAQKRELGCPETRSLEEVLVTQTNAAVLTATISESEQHAVGISSGVFQDLGEDVERFMQEAGKKGQQVAMMVAGKLNEFEVDGKTYGMIDSGRGHVSLENTTDSTTLKEEEGYDKCVEHLNWCVYGETFLAADKEKKLDTNTLDMKLFNSKYFGSKDPTTVYKASGYGNVEMNAFGSIPALRAPRGSRSSATDPMGAARPSGPSRRSHSRDSSHVGYGAGSGETASATAPMMGAARPSAPPRSPSSASSMRSPTLSHGASVGASGAAPEQRVLKSVVTTVDGFKLGVKMLTGPGTYFNYKSLDGSADIKKFTFEDKKSYGDLAFDGGKKGFYSF